MNLIFLTERMGSARSVDISGRQLAAGALLCALCLAGIFGAGYLSGSSGKNPGPSAELADLREEMAAQRLQVAEAREQAQERLDALAIRMGELNANVIRLNALGRRLTSMADLSGGEFNFDQVPALGGVEEPAAAAALGGQMPDLFAGMDDLDAALTGQRKQLGVLESVLMSRKLEDLVRPSGRPVEGGWLSSYFGKRTDPFTGKPASHKGVDFAGKAGSQIYAVAAGVVSRAKEDRGYGYMVEVNHGNGYVTRYAHNAENLVNVGDYVEPGQAVALMGSTGRSTGPHLHFEVLRNGVPVNPLKYIEQGK